MKKINLIVLLGTISISTISYSQDTLTISKKDIWQKASDKNLQIKIANQDFKSAQAGQVLKTLCFYFIGINFAQVLWSIFYAFQDVKRYGRMEFVRIYSIL